MFKRPRALLLIASLLSCKDPTQIMVTVTTDGACSADATGKAFFNSVGVAGAREFPSKQAVAFNGSQDYCEAAPLVGSLVLVPADERADNLVEVLVVAGFRTDDGKESQTAESCEGKRVVGSGIQGLNCIVARRRLGFLESTPLSLPIDLDTRCLGVECGEDLTCFQGECVSPDAPCDEKTGECVPVVGGGGAGAGGDGGAPVGGGAGGGGGPALELCNNGMDDDANAFTDCDDAECSSTLYCNDLNTVVINELSVVGDDQEFIELYNRGTTSVDLRGAVISLNEGSIGALSSPYVSLPLDGFVLGAGEYLVLHDSTLTPPAGVASLPFASDAADDQIRQDAETASVVLHLAGGSTLLDAVVYGGTPSFLEIEGMTYSPELYLVTESEDGSQPADSLSRIPNGGLGMPAAVWQQTTSVTIGSSNMVSAGTEDCTNAPTDDDGDGLVDCADPECGLGTACGVDGLQCIVLNNGPTCACPGGTVELNCSGGGDDDCDGFADCQDDDCDLDSNCFENCNNGFEDPDNDQDADCADDECNGQVCGSFGRICISLMCTCPGGTVEDNCNDGGDDDCDGATDCADQDCSDTPPCEVVGTLGITAYDPPVATLTGQLDIHGSGFMAVTSVLVGNISYTPTVLNDGHLVVSSIDAGTPLGNNIVTLYAGASSLTDTGVTVVNLLIKQLDARTAGPGLDFLQLQTGLAESHPLNGYIVAFVDGDGPGGINRVSTSFALTGTTTMAGTYLIAGPNVPVVAQQPFPPFFLDIPPGTDAVAIYQLSVPLPPNSAPPMGGIIDALVFNGPDPDPTPSLNEFFMVTTTTISEDANPDLFAIHRCSGQRRDAEAYMAFNAQPNYMLVPLCSQ